MNLQLDKLIDFGEPCHEQYASDGWKIRTTTPIVLNN